MIDLTPIFSGVITVVFLVIAIMFIPYIKSRVSDEKLSEIMVWVNIFVSAAEQIYRAAGSGKEKKEWVMKKLEEKGYKIDLDILSDLVEAEVLRLKK